MHFDLTARLFAGQCKGHLDFRGVVGYWYLTSLLRILETVRGVAQYTILVSSVYYTSQLSILH